MSIADRISGSWERDGLYGMALRTAVYFLRRVAWRTGAWSEQLDQSISRNAILKDHAALLERNAVFRDRHKGQRCFVIGNGPSLKFQDLGALSSEITLVTNSFHLHPEIGKHWQPSYYCLSDPIYFNGVEPVSSLVDIATRITRADFFVPHYAREFLKKTGALPAERTYYVAACDGISADKNAKPDLTTSTPGIQTVVHLAIFVALFMGCSPIYLLGLDHDWLAHGGNHLNFYSEENAEDQPDGNLPGWQYHSMMDAVLMMWKVYELQQSIAQHAGVKIINCTRGGFLDVFERGNYEQIVADKLEGKALLQ